MKPFSKLEAIGNGKPVVTRSGKKVLQLFEIDADIEYPLVGLVEGATDVSTWTSDGNFSNQGAVQNLDLFMASTKHEGWIAFGPESAQTDLDLVAFATHVWPTEEAAKNSYRNANYDHEPAGTQKITWEE